MDESSAGFRVSDRAPAAIGAGALPTADKRLKADAMIAATALENDLQVVSRNVSHFAALGVPCIDPWLYAAAP